MQALSVVPDLDIVEQDPAHLSVTTAAGIDRELGFEGLKETLSRGIIPTVAPAGHRLGDLGVLQFIGKIGAGILGALIGMEQQLPAGRAAGAGLVPGGDRGGLGGHAIGQRPPDDLAIGQIHDGAQIQPALAAGQVGNIADPGLGKVIGLKVAPEQIRRHRQPVPGIGGPNPRGANLGGNSGLLHESCYARAAESLPAGQQGRVNTGTAIRFGRIVPNGGNFLG